MSSFYVERLSIIIHQCRERRNEVTTYSDPGQYVLREP
jgi:hypothetical protein